MTLLSRRAFVAATAAGFAVVPLRAQAPNPLTAQAVIDRIKAQVGGAWGPDGVDTMKFGDPATPVRGMVTTALASLPVLRQAVAKGANFVITAEPTFYARNDAVTGPGRNNRPDPVLQAKTEFLRANGLVVWRFSDHWRRRQPDPFVRGAAEALGWTRYLRSDQPGFVTIPETSLSRLSDQIRKAFDLRGGMRVIGRDDARIRTVALVPGTTAIAAAVTAFASADLMITGEVREWEIVEYVRDLVAAGERKALITTGRTVSDDYGMKVCAEWLRTVVPDITTTWIPAGDPYWRP